MSVQLIRRGELWRLCDRCKFLYPMSMLRGQLGLFVCTVTCTDNLDNQYRPMIIAEVLGEPKEADNLLGQNENYGEPGELEL